MRKLHKIYILTLCVFLCGCSTVIVDNTGSNSEETIVDTDVIDLSQYEGPIVIDKEGTYRIKGTLKNGQVVVEAGKEEKVELILDGVSISCSNSSAINCRQAKDLIITLEEGSENILKDGKDYKYDDPEKEEPGAALFSKCDLVIRGNGTLKVEGNHKHGIASKDDLKIEGGMIDVTSYSDGIRGKDSVTIENGTINISSGKDGIAATNDKDDKRGWIDIREGNFNIVSNGDGIQAETTMVISGGVFNITTQGKSTGSSASQKGLKAKDILTIYDGSFTFNTTDDSIHSNTDVIIVDGDLHIETEDDGIHADRDLVINAGTFDIPGCHEGMEATVITINGGNFYINADDDAIGASAKSEEAKAQGGGRNGNPAVNVYINGGEIEAVSQGDTIDSNGNIFVSGGKLRLTSPADPYYEGVLLCNGTVTITGGDLAMAGNIGVELTQREQPILLVSFPELQKKGETISLKDSNGTQISEVKALREYRQVIFSHPEMNLSETYIVCIDNEELLRVTLSEMINKVASDGGEFTGGYPRGHW